MCVHMVYAYPVMHGLRQLTRILPSRIDIYKFDEPPRNSNVKTYVNKNNKKDRIHAELDHDSFTCNDEKHSTPVFNHDYVMAQIRQEFDLPKKHVPGLESPSASSASSSSSDSDNHSTDSETTSRDAHGGFRVSGSSRSFFSSWTRRKGIQDAMKALDSISLFIDTDKENYCSINNVLPVVMKQTQKWIEKERNGSFVSFQKSTQYVSENAKLSRMIPFWKNLYYQFGLIHISLEGSLRPSRVPQHTHLLECCETICGAAQWQLYAKYDNWSGSYEEDLDLYQSTYNKTHGTLRWFEDDNENYLHISIHGLNPILTIWIMDDKREHKVERSILKKVFKITDVEYNEASKCMSLMKDTRHDNPTAYAKLLTLVLEWDWNVKTGEEQVYNNIYDAAVKECEQKGMSQRMMYIEAVEHHRRYDTQVGPSVFWSGRR